MLDLKIKYNELTAEQFIELWETVWGDGPSLEQTRLAMKHTLFRVSIWDGDCIVAMARMNGDMGLNYYIKDVVVRPEYQGKGYGRDAVNVLLQKPEITFPVTLHVTEENEAAFKIYKRMGFVTTQELMEYWY